MAGKFLIVATGPRWLSLQQFPPAACIRSHERRHEEHVARKRESGEGDFRKSSGRATGKPSINVGDFVVRHIKPYAGVHEFLAGPSQRTNAASTAPAHRISAIAFATPVRGADFRCRRDRPGESPKARSACRKPRLAAPNQLDIDQRKDPRAAFSFASSLALASAAK